MRKWLAIKILKWWGWKIVGRIPNEVPKKLYVAVPHTSNWDFPIGLLLNAGYDMEVGYMAKHTLFKPPFGWFFRATGGIPVDRTRKTNIIQSIIDTFDQQDRFCTCISPEGTRTKTDRLKTGFYYIAKGANVPLAYVTFDWGNMNLVFHEPKTPADTVEEELEHLHELFKDIKGKVPEYSYGYPFENE